MAYSSSDLKLDLDQVAKIEDILQTELGDGSGAVSISARAKSIRTRITTSNDIQTELKALSGAHKLYQASLASPDDTTAGVAASSGVIGSHYWTMLRSLYGDVKTALGDLDVRMHPKAAENYQKANAGVWPDPSIVFPLETELGTVVRGVTAWTFTAGSEIDEDKYAPTRMELVPDGTIGAANITVSLSMIPSAGANAVPVQVVIEAGETEPVSIGLGRYIGVADITCTGGTNGDELTLTSVQERELPQ